jgi:hypothetical protein
MHSKSAIVLLVAAGIFAVSVEVSHASDLSVYSDASGLVAGRIEQPIRLTPNGAVAAQERVDLEFNLPNGLRALVGVERLSSEQFQVLNRGEQSATEAMKGMAMFAYDPLSRTLLLSGQPQSGVLTVIKLSVQSPAPYDYAVAPAQLPAAELPASLKSVIGRFFKPASVAAEPPNPVEPPRLGTFFRSQRLDKDLYLVDYPPYLAVPASFVLNDDQVMGVIVEKADAKHFVIEWLAGLVSIETDKDTRFLEWKRRRSSKRKFYKDLKNEDFETVDLRASAALARLRVGDVIHAAIRKVDPVKQGQENWMRASGDDYSVRQIVLFERGYWSGEGKSGAKEPTLNE